MKKCIPVMLLMSLTFCMSVVASDYPASDEILSGYNDPSDLTDGSDMNPDIPITEEFLSPPNTDISEFPSVGNNTNISVPDTGYCGDHVVYVLKDHVLTISGNGEMFGYYGLPWYDKLQYLSSAIWKIIIEEGVTGTGEYAFQNMTSLKEVSLPKSLKKIGAESFAGCSMLTALVIPDSVTSIGERAFMNCKRLENVTLSKSLKKLEDSVFFGCASLKRITIPDGMTAFGRSVFGNSGLETINLPAGMKDVRQGFYMSSIKTVYYAGSKESWYALISDHDDMTAPLMAAAIYDKDGNRIPLPDSGNKDGVSWKLDSDGTLVFSGEGSADFVYTFSGNPDIKRIVFMEGITEIGSPGMFTGCSNVREVSCPASMIKIADHVFKDCVRLTKISLPSGLGSIEPGLFMNCSKLQTISIPSSVRNIGEDAFNGCAELKNVAFPEGIERLNARVLAGCSSLVQFTIPDSVTRIADGAFKSCSALASITIPKNVTSVGHRAFYNCMSLRTIVITRKSLSFGYSAFEIEDKNADESEILITRDVYYPGTLEEWFFYYDRTQYYRYNHAKVVLHCDGNMYDNYGKVSSVWWTVTREGTLSVGGEGEITSDLHINSTSVKEIIIGEGITYIGKGLPVSGCMDITMPDTVVEIGEKAFYGYPGSSIRLSAALTKIGAEAFMYSALKTIEIPSTVTEIGSRAFCDCTNLEKCSFQEKSNLETIRYQAFANCSKLTSIALPDSVCSVETEAFRYSSIKKIRIPGRLDKESVWAFRFWDGEPDPMDVYYNGTPAEWQQFCGTTSVFQNAVVHFLPDGRPYKTEISSVSSLLPGQMKLTWNRVQGVSGYQLRYALDPSMKSAKTASVAGDRTTSYTRKDLTGGEIYYVQVRSCLDDMDGATRLYSEWSPALSITILTSDNPAPSPALETPTIPEIRLLSAPAEGKLHIEWSSCLDADGYQIRYGTDKDLNNAKTASYTGLSCTRSGLQEGMEWYVRVRSYKTISGQKIYSLWSQKKSLLLIGKPAPTVITRLEIPGSGQMRIRWRSNPASDGYQIMYGTDGNFTDGKTASVTSNRITSHTRKNLESGTVYYAKVRTYRLSNGKRIYSNWSGIKTILVD